MKSILKRLSKKLPRRARVVANRAYRMLGTPYARTRMSIGMNPLSVVWGSDRGQEIARYYIEELFLKEFADDVQGRCLEFLADNYTSRFGQENRITSIDILNMEDGNPRTTIHADLTKPNDIPSNQYDCIVCTHVLHVIYELDRAIAELHRILRPGGVLLVAVPQVSMCDSDWGELWRFTQEGLRAALTRAFEDQHIAMRAYGNSLTAAGEIRGLATHEFAKMELNQHDQRFAVEICARAIKSAGTG